MSLPKLKFIIVSGDIGAKSTLEGKGMNVGGYVVLHTLAKILDSLGMDVKMYISSSDNDTEDSPTNLKTLYQMVDVCNENDVYTKHKIKLTTPLKKFTKKKCWDLLGSGIQEKVWWCREEEICGECFQCKEMECLK